MRKLLRLALLGAVAGSVALAAVWLPDRRQLGRAIELDKVLFVGGGTVALADHITDWFPNQLIANEPAFANARGMRKYLQHVCEKSDAA